MKANEFKAFYEIAAEDVHNVCYMGYAFMQLTDKQAVKIIDLYIAQGEAKIEKMANGKMYIRFGSNGSVMFPFEKYTKIKNAGK